jgi:hypothetical protein
MVGVLKKHGLLTEKEANTETDRAKTAEVLKGYQDELSKKDEEISELKSLISKLEEAVETAEVSLNDSVSLRRASMLFSTQTGSFHKGQGPSFVAQPTSQESNRLSTINSSLLPDIYSSKGNINSSNHSINQSESRRASINVRSRRKSVSPNHTHSVDEIGFQEEEKTENWKAAEDLEKNYQQRLQDLKNQHQKELKAHLLKREKLTKQWEIRIGSLTRLQKTSKLQKALERQKMLLKMIGKHYKPKSQDQAIQVNLAGRNLRELDDKPACLSDLFHSQVPNKSSSGSSKIEVAEGDLVASLEGLFPVLQVNEESNDPLLQSLNTGASVQSASKFSKLKRQNSNPTLLSNRKLDKSTTSLQLKVEETLIPSISVENIDT